MTSAEETGRLSERLGQTFRAVADNLPQNASVRIERNGTEDDLAVIGLDRIEDPASLIARAWQACSLALQAQP